MDRKLEKINNSILISSPRFQRVMLSQKLNFTFKTQLQFKSCNHNFCWKRKFGCVGQREINFQKCSLVYEEKKQNKTEISGFRILEFHHDFRVGLCKNMVPRSPFCPVRTIFFWSLCFFQDNFTKFQNCPPFLLATGESDSSQGKSWIRHWLVRVIQFFHPRFFHLCFPLP